MREADAFNIFTILKKGHEEVNLHSQFIGHLLNPDESHKKGNEFLKAFLKICGETIISNKALDLFNSEKAKIEIEKSIGIIDENYKKGGQIDLILSDQTQNNNQIIIENKIFALDQRNQLLRYYNYNQNALLFYLTLNGSRPDEISTNKQLIELKHYYCISYSHHISNWIDECIKIAALNPPLRETLLQYKKLIGELTGNTMSINERIELRDFLAKGDNALNAQIIVGNWNHIKWHTEWDFWSYFEDQIKKDGFEILEKNKFSTESLDRKIHQTRNRGEFGFMFEIGKIEETNFYVYIQRADFGTIVGIRVYGEFTSDKIVNNGNYIKLESLVVDYHLSEKNGEWMGYKLLEPKDLYSDETTLRLMNKSFREKYINDRWAEIKPFIEACQKAFN